MHFRIDTLAKHHYRTSVMIALVLSAMVVTLFAVVSRGFLNLQGAVYLSEPREVTVIALTEEKLPAETSITNVTFLRKEPDPTSDKDAYTYMMDTSDGAVYFVELKYGIRTGVWNLGRFERLHEAPATETAPSR